MTQQLETVIVYGLSAAGLALFLWALPFSLDARRMKPLGCPTCHAGWMALIVTQVGAAWSNPAWVAFLRDAKGDAPGETSALLVGSVLVGLYALWVYQRAERADYWLTLASLFALLAMVVGGRIFVNGESASFIVLQQLAVWAIATVAYKAGAVLELPPEADPLPEGLLVDDAPPAEAETPKSGPPTERAGS